MVHNGRISILNVYLQENIHMYTHPHTHIHMHRQTHMSAPTTCIHLQKQIITATKQERKQNGTRNKDWKNQPRKLNNKRKNKRNCKAMGGSGLYQDPATTVPTVSVRTGSTVSIPHLIVNKTKDAKLIK